MRYSTKTLRYYGQRDRALAEYARLHWNVRRCLLCGRAVLGLSYCKGECDAVTHEHSGDS